jgi:hypothetical protein
MGSETLSVRLDLETRRMLDEEAAARNSGGASTLAREILEREVRALRSARVRAQTERVAAMIAADPATDLWGDVDFYPAKDV